MKLSRNLKHLILLVISSYFIYYSECLENKNTLFNKFEIKNKNSNSNSNHYGNSNQNLAHVAAAAAATEKINLNTGIFLNSGNLKHRKVNKSSNMYSSSVENNNKNFNSNSNFNANNYKNKNKQNDFSIDANSDLARNNNLIEKAYEASRVKYNDLTTKKIDLSKAGPILMHGWVKYFKYNDEFLEDKKAKLKINNPTPKKFFINGEFNEQLKFFPGQDYSQKDKDDEYKFVKSEEFFYLIAYKNIITIFSTKEVNKKFNY